jgi:hypothetical protein
MQRLDELEELQTHIEAPPRLRVLIIGSNRAVVSRIKLWLSLARHYSATVDSGANDICRALDFLPHVIVLVLGSISLTGVEIAKSIREYAVLRSRPYVSVIAATEAAADNVSLGVRVDHFVPADDTSKLQNLIARLAPSIRG